MRVSSGRLIKGEGLVQQGGSPHAEDAFSVRGGEGRSSRRSIPTDCHRDMVSLCHVKYSEPGCEHSNVCPCVPRRTVSRDKSLVLES